METAERLRNKCAACYRQFNKKEHLVDHMRISYHSVHEPTCRKCQKHCRSFESLREHLIGPKPKAECERIFKNWGCDLCLTILSSRTALRIHQETCKLSRGLLHCTANLGIYDDLKIDDNSRKKVVPLACKMVGGGSDRSLDLCARVCLVDEYENIIFHTYVRPQLPVTNYRYETTGIRPEFLRNAMPLRQVSRKIQDFLCNGESIWKIRSRGGKTRILVGHGLDHDLKCLDMEYPAILIRYDIQTGIQDPYEDCFATTRLYMRMRSQVHEVEDYPLANDPQNRNNFAQWRQNELEKMNPEELLEVSRSDYYCWCLDSKKSI